MKKKTGWEVGSKYVGTLKGIPVYSNINVPDDVIYMLKDNPLSHAQSVKKEPEQDYLVTVLKYQGERIAELEKNTEVNHNLLQELVDRISGLEKRMDGEKIEKLNPSSWHSSGRFEEVINQLIDRINAMST